MSIYHASECPFRGTEGGTKLSFNLPAIHGCGFRCKHCVYILENANPGKREHFTNRQMSPRTCIGLIKSFRESSSIVDFGKFPLNGISINGAQAFGDGNSILLTDVIIRAAWQEGGIPTSVISSGVGVPECLDILTQHRTMTYITLWDGVREENDRLRPAVFPDGTPDPSQSAYDIATEALHALVTTEELLDKVRIACSFKSGDVKRALNVLRLVPDHIREHVTFVFEPMIQVTGRNQREPFHSKAQFLTDAEKLIRAAEKEGLRILFDDEKNEFNLFDYFDENVLVDRRNDYVVRVHPNGVVTDGFCIGQKQHDDDYHFDVWTGQVDRAPPLAERF